MNKIRSATETGGKVHQIIKNQVCIWASLLLPGAPFKNEPVF